MTPQGLPEARFRGLAVALSFGFLRLPRSLIAIFAKVYFFFTFSPAGRVYDRCMTLYDKRKTRV